MGIIKFRTDPFGAQQTEREEREKFAEESNNATETVEFSSIRANMKKLKEMEKIENLRKYGVGLDCPIEVQFGAGFNDEKSYTSLEELEKEESKNTSLTESELVFRGFIC